MDLFSLTPFSLSSTPNAGHRAGERHLSCHREMWAPNAGQSGKQPRQPSSHSHHIGWFTSAGLGFLRWKFMLAWALLSCLWLGLFVSIVTTRTLLQKSPQGEGVEDTVSGGKFSVMARGGHLPHLCPMPPWHSPRGKDGKEDRRDRGREASLVLRRCPWWL